MFSIFYDAVSWLYRLQTFCGLSKVIHRLDSKQKKMVRVIPVHNFLEQNASQIEEPTSICVACLGDGREVVLLSLPSHCVEVRDLTLSNLQYITTFPTVDLVSKMVHCMKGNYVATLEVKVPQENSHSSRFILLYSKIYVQISL